MEKTNNVMEYLSVIKADMIRVRKARGSKVEAQLFEVVNKNIEDGVANTIKQLCEATGKRIQQVHSVVKKSARLGKTKVNGFTIVVPVGEGLTKNEEGYIKELLKDEPLTRPAEVAAEKLEEELNDEDEEIEDDETSAEADAEADFEEDEDEEELVDCDDEDEQ